MKITEIKNLIANASFSKKQTEVINILVNKIYSLDDNVKKLASQLLVSHNVSTILQTQLDDQEAYSRRPCMIISGMTKNKQDQEEEEKTLQEQVLQVLSETGIPKKEIEANIDKMHPLGKPSRNNSQPVIVRFKGHNFKERIYKRRKNIKQRYVKLRPSLTRRRSELLEEVNTEIEADKSLPVQFAFADVHGTLKVLMAEGITPKFQGFNTMLEFRRIIDGVGFSDPYSDDEVAET